MTERKRAFLLIRDTQTNGNAPLESNHVHPPPRIARQRLVRMDKLGRPLLVGIKMGDSLNRGEGRRGEQGEVARELGADVAVDLLGHLDP